MKLTSFLSLEALENHKPPETTEHPLIRLNIADPIQMEMYRKIGSVFGTAYDICRSVKYGRYEKGSSGKPN